MTNPFPWLRCMLLAALLLAGTAETAHAQIWKRAKERAEQRLNRKVEEKVDEAVDEAVDKAVDGAADAAAASVSQRVANSQAAADLQESLNALSAAYGIDSGIEPVDFRELKGLLPERLGSRARTDASGQKSSALGIRTSAAEGLYEGGGQGNIRLSIIDLGSLQSAAMFGYAWLVTELDVENEQGYERTVTYKGFPAYERVSREGDHQSSQMQAVVGQRFVVAAEGNDVAIDELRAALDQVDVARLEGMRTVGMSEEAIQAAQANQQQLAAAFAQADSAAAGIEPVDYALLKDLLPAGLSGMTRADASGQKSSAMGIRMSGAEGLYESGDASITVSIVDMGTLTGLAMLGYAWLVTEFDAETDTGYERTTQYKGYPAYETFSREGDYPSSQMQVVVGQRFIVAVEGNDVAMDQVKAALDRIDLGKLESLK